MECADPSSPRPISLLVVEDHPIVRLGMTTFFQTQDDIRVLAETGNCGHALDIAATEDVDLVLLPLRLEGKLLGLDICRDLKSLPEPPRVLMYTAFSSPSEASLAYLSGADSLLSKADSEQNLLAAVRATASSERVWRPASDTREQADVLKARIENAGLTKREGEVLGLMLQSYSNIAIAGQLFIEVSTVKSHVSHILQKLGVTTRDELLI